MTASESQRLLNEVITTLGWTNEFISNASRYKQCYYEKNHWVPTKSISTHKDYCSLRQLGYLREEINAMIANADVCATDYSQPTTDWTNDPSWIMNMEAFYTDKSSSGRRSSNNSSQDVSKLEALSMMRDAKRRRQSYRGIHTARKSYTEILREIIAQQTEILTAAHGSIQQSEDKRCGSVESFESNKEIVKQRHGSNKYNKPTSPTSRQIHPSDDSRYGKTNNCSEQSRRRLARRRRYNSPKRDDDDNNKQQPTCQYSPSSADYRYNNSNGHCDDVDNNKPKKSKKHKKHSKSKHKHRHKS